MIEVAKELFPVFSIFEPDALGEHKRREESPADVFSST
jgi:hypothetical protein